MCRATIKWTSCTCQVGSSRDVLWSHPIADVLSPIASMHDCADPGLRHSNHILIVIPMNSSRLLTPGWPLTLLAYGMRIRHAIPDKL